MNDNRYIFAEQGFVLGRVAARGIPNFVVGQSVRSMPIAKQLCSRCLEGAVSCQCADDHGVRSLHCLFSAKALFMI